MNVESNETNEQYDASQININLDILQAKLDSNEDLAGLKDEITGLTDNKEVLSERLEEYNYQNIIKEFINEVDTTKPVDEQKDQIENFEAKKDCLQVFVALNVLGGVYQGAINKSMIVEGDVTTLDKDKVRSIVDSKDTSSFQGVLDSVDHSIFDSTEGKIFNWLSDNRESSFVTDLISESDYSEMQSVMQESMYGQDDKEGLIDAYQERMNMNMFDKMRHYGENALQRAQYYAEEGIEQGSKKAKELSEWAKDNPKQAGLGAGSIALGYMLIKKVFGKNNSSGGLISSVTGWMKNNKLLTVLGGTGVFFGLNKFLGGTANAESNDGVEASTRSNRINNSFEKLSENDKEKYNIVGENINSFYSQIFDGFEGGYVSGGKLGDGIDSDVGVVPHAIDDIGNIGDILDEGIEGQMSGLLSLDKDQLFDRLKNMPKNIAKNVLLWLENKVSGGLNYLSDSTDGFISSMSIDKFAERFDNNGEKFIEENINTIQQDEIQNQYQEYFRKYSRSIVYLQNTRERLYYKLVKDKLDNPTEAEIKDKINDEEWLEEKGILEKIKSKFYRKSIKDIPEILNEFDMQSLSLEDQNTYISKTVGKINKKRDEALAYIDSEKYEKASDFLKDEIDGILDNGFFADMMSDMDEDGRQNFINQSGLSNNINEFKEEFQNEFNEASKEEKKQMIEEFFAIKKEIDTGIGITTKLVNEGENKYLKFGLNSASMTVNGAKSLVKKYFSFVLQQIYIGFGEIKDGDGAGLVRIGGTTLLTVNLSRVIGRGTGRTWNRILPTRVLKDAAPLSWRRYKDIKIFKHDLIKGKLSLYDASIIADHKLSLNRSDWNTERILDEVFENNNIPKYVESYFDDDILKIDGLLEVHNDEGVNIISRGWNKINLKNYKNLKYRLSDDSLESLNYLIKGGDGFDGFGSNFGYILKGLKKGRNTDIKYINFLNDNHNKISKILDGVDSKGKLLQAISENVHINSIDDVLEFADKVRYTDGLDLTPNLIRNVSMKSDMIDFSKSSSKIIDDYGLNNNHLGEKSKYMVNKLNNGLENVSDETIRFIENGLTDSRLMSDISKAKMAGSIDSYDDIQKFARVVDGSDGVDEMVARHVLYEYGGDIDKVDDIGLLKKQASEYLNMHQTAIYNNVGELKLADNVGEFTGLLRNGDDVNSLARKILNNWDGANTQVQMRKAKAYAYYIIDGVKKGNIAVDGVDVSSIYRTSSEAKIGIKKALSRLFSNENGYISVDAISSNKVSKSIDSTDTIKLSNKTETLDVQKTSDNLVDILDNGVSQKELNAFQKAINQKGDMFEQIGDHILRNSNIKSKLVKANSIDEVKSIFNSVDDINLNGISDDALEVFVKTDSVDQIDTLAKISKNSEISDLALWGTRVSSILFILSLVADVYYGMSNIKSAQRQQEIYSEYNTNRANIEGQRVGLHGAGMAMDLGGTVLGTKAIMASILGGSTPAGRIGLGIVGASYGIRGIGDNVLDVRSSYYRNYEDYKNKHETEVKNSIIALQASQDGVDVGTYNNMESLISGFSWIGDPNLDERDLDQTQKYASQALVHFDVAEDIEMGWLVSNENMMKKQLDEIKLQKQQIKQNMDGDMQNMYLAMIDNQIETIQKQRAKFEAQVEIRTKYINDHLDEYIESFDSFDGFNNIDRLIRDSKIYEREKRNNNGLIDKMSSSYPMFLNDLVDYDVLDIENLDTEWQTFETAYDSSKHYELEEDTSFELKKIKGQYRKNNNGELELRINNVDIPAHNMKDYNKIERRVNSGELIEQGQSIIVNKKDIDILKKSQEYDYRSNSRKYMFSYETESDFDYEKSKTSYENKLKAPEERMDLKNIPKDAFKKLNQIYENYPIEFNRMINMLSNYRQDYPNRVKYLSKFMDYKKSYPTIQGDINEKQTQNMHNFDLRTTNDIESFIKNFEFTENGYTNGEIKQSLADGNFELYTSSSIENDLGWSDSPVQNIIYRIACEVHGYDGKNKMIELQNFFSEDQRDNRGIYYDGSIWRMRTVGIGFTSKRIDEYTIEGQKAWMSNLKDSLLNRSGRLVDQDEDAGETLISGIMTEQIVDIINQEKEIIDNKSNIKENIQKYIQNHSNGKYIQLPMDILINSTRAGISNIGKYMYKYENNKIKAISQESIKDNESERPDFIDSVSYIEGSELTIEQQKYLEDLDMKKDDIMKLYDSHKKSHTYSSSGGIIGRKISLAPNEDFQNYFEDLLSEYEDFKNDFKSRGEDKRQEYIKKANWDEKLEKIHIALLSVGEPQIKYEDRDIFDYLTQSEPVSIDFDNGTFKVQNIIQGKFDSWIGTGIQDELKEYSKNVGIKEGRLVYVKDSNQQGIKTIDSLEKISSEQNKNLTQKGYNTILKSILQKRLSKSPNLSMGSEIEKSEIGDIIESNINNL